MTFALVANQKKAGNGAGGTITSTGIDTTAGGGAELIVVQISGFTGDDLIISDSQSMSDWHYGSTRTASANVITRMAYISAFDGSFATDASHTFTMTNGFGGLMVQAWTGIITASDPFRDQNGAQSASSGTSTTASGINVGAEGDLIIIGGEADVGTSFTITGASADKALSDSQSFVGSTVFGFAMGYDQGASGAGVGGAETLQLNWSTAANWGVSLMAFKPLVAPSTGGFGARSQLVNQFGNRIFGGG